MKRHAVQGRERGTSQDRDGCMEEFRPDKFANGEDGWIGEKAKQRCGGRTP